MRKNHLSSLISLITLTSVSAVAQDDATDDLDDFALEEVIVTAQHKQESLQDAGLAIDVIAASDLEQGGVSNGIDLSEAVPALQVLNGGGSSTNVILRGVGNRSNGPAVDQAVTFNYDGVALGRGTGAFEAFYDLERVEVLKGPQGTLYGKNSTGGVVSIVPAKPVLGESGGSINGSIGNYNTRETDGALNIGLGDEAAMRLAWSFAKRDGYNNDDTFDQDRKSLRAQIMFEPSGSFNVRLAGDFGRFGGTGPAQTPYFVFPNRPPGSSFEPGSFNDAVVPTDLPLNEGPTSDRTTAVRNSVGPIAPAFGLLGAHVDNMFLDVDTDGVNAEINVELGSAATLTVIPAYRETKVDTITNSNSVKGIMSDDSAEQTSLEARLAGSVGLVDYIVGTHLIDENLASDITINLQYIVPIQNTEYENDSSAVFGEFTFNITDETRLIAGGRYTEDKKSVEGFNETLLVSCSGPDPLAPPPVADCMASGMPGLPLLEANSEAYFNELGNNLITVPGLIVPVQEVIQVGDPMLRPPQPGINVWPLINELGAVQHITNPDVNSEEKWKESTFRVSAEQDIWDDTLLYLTYSAGYRAGGFDPSGNAYDPEYLGSISVGMKSRLMNNRLQINAEAFSWDYTDQQISYNTVNALGAAETITQNIGQATIEGLEIDVLWLAAENTLISATAQYLDGTYDDFTLRVAEGLDSSNANCDFTDTGLLTSPPAGASPQRILDIDCSGTTAAYSPELVFKFAIDQTFPINSGMQIVASLDTTYTDERQSSFFNRETDIIDSYTLTNINLTLESTDGDWYVTAYGRNLEDEFNVQAIETPINGISSGYTGIDATYGVRFGLDF